MYSHHPGTIFTLPDRWSPIYTCNPDTRSRRPHSPHQSHHAVKNTSACTAQRAHTVLPQSQLAAPTDQTVANGRMIVPQSTAARRHIRVREQTRRMTRLPTRATTISSHTLSAWADLLRRLASLEGRRRCQSEFWAQGQGQLSGEDGEVKGQRAPKGAEHAKDMQRTCNVRAAHTCGAGR